MLLQNVFLFCLVVAVHSVSRDVIKHHQAGRNSIKSNEPANGLSSKMTLQHKFSTPEECARTCKDGEQPRNCYYHFTMEYYTTMNKACEKLNNTDEIATNLKPHCIEADGFERGMLSINRMLPGPSIQVCQNDKIIVDVQNNIEGMEVTIHWHGIWQQGSQYYDGVPFLTQCPIVSGTTFRYQFIASNPGTHFYHSHAGLQKPDGQYGSLIVRQPRKFDPHAPLYDEDLPTHVILLSDWMHEMAIARFPGLRRNRPGQLPENVLINGRGRWTDPATNQTTSVRLESFVVQPGRRYRFRLINSFSSVCPAQLTIEGHSLTLIAQDAESVVPVPVNTIITSSGERVDFILNANQTVGAYWIQVRASGECAKQKISQFAILNYKGSQIMRKTLQFEYKSNGLPRGIVYNDPDTNCEQRESNNVCADHLKSLKRVPKEILKPKPDHRIELPYRFFSYKDEDLFKSGDYPRFLTTAGGTHITSLIAGISFKFPEVPPLSQDINSSGTCNADNLPTNCGTPCSCPHTHHIKKGAIVEVIVYDEVPETAPRLAHPFHLHGYAFHLLKIGRLPSTTRNSTHSLNEVIREHEKMLDSGKYYTPARKDTVAVAKGGYAIFRFKADNPGWWLFHCHFLYHTAIGMNVVFHVGERNDLPPVPPRFPTCSSYTPEVV